ncbi:putative 2-phosphodiesterase [Danaus plexippus plexippus]|uniref:2-phosphodiesterase n=1 Tax=Danaus plexippus plexippus TaxID=278856 RepID=A0A212ETZ2_DANPL|nr:putative 2-phosphodiesterase [Danaus plexippus plexippus]
MADFPVFPENLETLYAEKELNIYNWYRGKVNNSKGNELSDVHVEWNFIVSSFSYTPKSEDIGLKLKLECIPVNAKLSGPVVECISKNLVEAGPGSCPFETRHMFTPTKLNGKRFRCVSYNILADLYCDSDYTRTVLHPYCPPYALQIDYRKQLIMKELKGYNADIICLQEVDGKIFNKCLKPFLDSDNFNGLFYKKGKTVAEGLACFYNRLRFCLIEDFHILLAKVLEKESYLKNIFDIIKNNTALMERLLDRSSVASATVLQSIENPNEILVNPGKRISVILCGDYNSVPSCGIYQLFTTGLAPSSLEDWKSNANEAVHDLTLSQDILLDSACGTPKYTNFTQGFAECIDYIFYEKNNLSVNQVIPLPNEEELKAHIALPSVVFPSDHIALVSDLEFK